MTPLTLACWLLLPGIGAQVQWAEVETFPRLSMAAAAHDFARGQTILFGGTSHAIDQGRTYALDGRAWRRVHPPLSPAARLAHVMAYDAARDRIVLFGGQNWPNVRQTHLHDTWEWDGSTWMARPSSGAVPAARSFAALTYDPDRQRCVLFGGGNTTGLLGDTWEWDGSSWLLRAAAGPSPRAEHGMAWDPVGRRILLFGGYGSFGPLTDHTWSWDGTRWTQLAPSVFPPWPWWFSHLVTDRARNRIVLLGSDRTSVVWEWDGSSWLANSVSCPALGRRGASAAFHPPRAILVGGEERHADGNGHIDEVMGDTWSWDGTTCALVVPNQTPQGSYSQAMAFDRARRETVLFGGMNARSDQTWLFDGTRWKEVRPVLSPPERYLHGMTFDDLRQRVLLFGGSAYRAPFLRRSDTWEWDGCTWSELRPANRPTARGGHGLAYDRARRHAVLFGGYDENAAALNDTWVWDGTNWSEPHPAVRPPARICRMAYDSARQRTVLFGGWSRTGLFSDTWEWDGAAWLQRHPATIPPILFDEAWLPSLHYDDARERTVLHGVAVNPWQMETWEWDGTDWQPRPGPQPPRRIRQAAAFDAVRERGVMFGNLDDTWEIASAHPATYAAFGAGCSGSTGVPRLSASRPWLDGSWTITADNLPSSASAVCLAFGRSNQSWHGLPLPAALTGIGMAGCDLLVSFDMALGAPARGGRALLQLDLCACPVLAGLDFYNQVFVSDIGANVLGVIVSNGGAARLGLR